MNCNWVGKRVRSALDGGGGGKVALSGQSLQPLCPNNSDSSRDWANLGDGPAGRIGELALASDVADFARFRAVCRPWRRCSPDPRAGGLDSRFLPRQWIMLSKANAAQRCYRFLNVSTGECIRMDLPELAEHTLLALTPEGLLMLLHEPTLVVRLLNPVTHQLTDLPPVTALLSSKQKRSRHRGLEMGVMVSGVGLLADASSMVWVAVSFFDPFVVAVAKPGDDGWAVAHKGHMNATLPFAGRVYCADYRGVMVLTSDQQQQQPPRLQVVADRRKSFNFNPMANSLHLVDNGGELMLVHRTLCLDIKYGRKYDVYKVDLEAGVLVPVKGFNGRAVFMGMGRTISVSAETPPFPFITADTIYVGKECDSQIQGYNIADESRCSLIRPICPCSVVDCLRYCIQGFGTRLV